MSCFPPSFFYSGRRSKALWLLAFLAGLLACPATVCAEGGKWALLIGIDEYKDRNRLNALGGAAADARALGRTLVDIVGFPEDHVRLLVSDADPMRGEAIPEGATILRELADLAAKAQPGDTVIVAYSGHGVEMKDVPYLLPYDTSAVSEKTIEETAIRVKEFVERLKTVRAETLLLIFDMCRSDPHKGSKDIVSSNTLKEGQKQALTVRGQAANSVITLFACSPNQRSYEWPEKRRGYFSYFLDEGLRGKAADEQGTIQLNRLLEYVARNVEDTVRTRESRSQTPFLDGTVAPLVLARNVVYSANEKIEQAKSEMIDTDAVFRLSVSPRDAEVTIDGVPMDGRSARFDLGIVREKTVTIRVQASGYQSEEREVTLKRGLNPPISFLLSSLMPEEETFTPKARPPVAPATGRAAVASPNRKNAIRSYGTTPNVAAGRIELVSEPRVLVTSRRTSNDGEAGMRITIQAGSYREEDVRLVYRPLALEEGGVYRVRFRVRASAKRTINVVCATNEGEEIGFNSRYILDADWQQIDFTFRANGISSRFNLAPVLLLGNSRGEVEVSGISVEPQ